MAHRLHELLGPEPPHDPARSMREPLALFDEALDIERLRLGRVRSPGIGASLLAALSVMACCPGHAPAPDEPPRRVALPVDARVEADADLSDTQACERAFALQADALRTPDTAIEMRVSGIPLTVASVARSTLLGIRDREVRLGMYLNTRSRDPDADGRPAVQLDPPWRGGIQVDAPEGVRTWKPAGLRYGDVVLAFNDILYPASGLTGQPRPRDVPRDVPYYDLAEQAEILDEALSSMPSVAIRLRREGRLHVYCLWVIEE